MMLITQSIESYRGCVPSHHRAQRDQVQIDDIAGTVVIAKDE